MTTDHTKAQEALAKAAARFVAADLAWDKAIAAETRCEKAQARAWCAVVKAAQVARPYSGIVTSGAHGQNVLRDASEAVTTARALAGVE